MTDKPALPTKEERYATIKPIVSMPTKRPGGTGYDAVAVSPAGFIITHDGIAEEKLDMTSHAYTYLNLKTGLFIDFKRISHVEELAPDDPLHTTTSRVVVKAGSSTRHVPVPLTLEQVTHHLLLKSEVPVKEFETAEGRKAVSPVFPQGRGAVVSLRDYSKA